MKSGTPADRLRHRVFFKIGAARKSISVADIQALDIDQNIVMDIHSCLQTEDVQILSTGFFFLNSLLQKFPAKNFGSEFVSFLIKRVRDLLNHESEFVCSKALELFIWLRQNYPDYRDVMLSYLSSKKLGCRKIALNNFETFAERNEVTPLVKFYSDNYAAENSMMGVMRYELRDIALEKIEFIIGKKVRLAQLSETYDGGTVTWYDWTPFLLWWEKNKASFK
jgi:hypothetical protein